MAHLSSFYFLFLFFLTSVLEREVALPADDVEAIHSVVEESFHFSIADLVFGLATCRCSEVTGTGAGDRATRVVL